MLLFRFLSIALEKAGDALPNAWPCGYVVNRITADHFAGRDVSHKPALPNVGVLSHDKRASLPGHFTDELCIPTKLPQSFSYQGIVVLFHDFSFMRPAPLRSTGTLG